MASWRNTGILIFASICALAQQTSARANAQLTGFTVIGSDPQIASAPATQTPLYDYIFKNRFEAPCGEDADSDGLPDCVETNTHVYVSASNTGTDPHNPDTDGDGLLDGEEVHGTLQNLNLPAMGANPLHKDILIQYDWFDDTNGCTQHSHRPTATMVQNVHDFFATAPISNPDGNVGINVIQDYGQGGAFAGGGHQIIDPLNPSAHLTGGPGYPQYNTYEAANFPDNRHGYFHYALMAHEYSDSNGNVGSTGSAVVGGGILMVTMGCLSLPTTQHFMEYSRNTIVHELGHNLGLQHGGDEPCNYKPNYNSVMNYAFQLYGVDTTCDAQGDNNTLNYSSGTRRTLNENSLNETLGVCASPVVPIDWNHNGTYSTSLVLDINSYGQEISECLATNTILHDYNDWANLKVASVSPLLNGSGSSKAPYHPTVVSCAPLPNF